MTASWLLFSEVLNAVFGSQLARIPRHPEGPGPWQLSGTTAQLILRSKTPGRRQYVLVNNNTVDEPIKLDGDRRLDNDDAEARHSPRIIN